MTWRSGMKGIRDDKWISSPEYRPSSWACSGRVPGRGLCPEADAANKDREAAVRRARQAALRSASLDPDRRVGVATQSALSNRYLRFEATQDHRIVAWSPNQRRLRLGCQTSFRSASSPATATRRWLLPRLCRMRYRWATVGPAASDRDPRNHGISAAGRTARPPIGR